MKAQFFHKLGCKTLNTLNTQQTQNSSFSCKVFLISDIHTDYEENLDWIRDLSTTSFLNDALIVAGDVSDSIPIFEETFRILRPKFAHVFFTPGNHDLWLRSNTAPVPQTASEPLAKPDSKPASEPTSEPGPGADINPRTDDETNPETEGNPATVPVSTPEPGRSDASRAGSNFTQVTKGVSENHRAPASSTLLGVDISDPPENSLSKLAELFKICEDLGVDTRPKFLKPVGESGRTREAGSASEHGGELSEGRGLGESSLVGDRADDGKNGLQAVPDSQRRETNGRGSIGECSCIADISASVDKTDCVARTLSHIGEGERKKEAGTSERVASDSVQPVDGSARSSLTGKKEAQRTSGSEAGLNGENEGRTAEARVVDTSSSLDGRLRGPEEWLKSQTGENGGGGNPVREPENRTRGSEDGVRTEENGSRAHESGTKGGETGTSGAETGTRGGETGTSGGEIGTRGGETGTNGVESERRGGGSESKGCGDGPGGSVSEAESGRGSGVAEEAHSLAGVWVVPILSWHHISFDTEPDIPGYKIPPIEKVRTNLEASSVVSVMET